MNYYEQLQTDKWKSKRSEILDRDNYKCQKCFNHSYETKFKGEAAGSRVVFEGDCAGLAAIFEGGWAGEYAKFEGDCDNNGLLRSESSCS